MNTVVDKRKIFQVSEVTRLIKSILEDEIGYAWIEGEVSNLSRPASGHIYFTLKDERAQLRAALFRGKQSRLAVDIKDGAKLRAYGAITVYERSGQYQLIVERVEDAGKGDLHKQFEELKKKLSAEGLFDEDRKQALPTLVQRVGIVTSTTGAAIRDMLHVLNRRFPNMHILIAPAPVQGEGSADKIAASIDALNAYGGVDAIIVGRGGGSLEDLWSFNEEIVARAIARSTIPIVSAVGHETDFTISDFVADVRAPTPSAAAEIVVGLKEHFEENLGAYSQRIGAALRTQMMRIRHRVEAASRSYVFREPAHLVARYRQRLDQLRDGMTVELSSSIRETQQQIDEMGLRMVHRAELTRNSCRHKVDALASQLRALSPLAVLDRGYSVTRNANGEVVASADAITIGEVLSTQLANGIIESIVEKKTKGTSNDNEDSK